MGNGCCVFDLLDCNTRSLQSGDRRLSSGTWPFDPHLDLFDAELGSLLGGLLGRHLTSKGSALARSFKIAGPGTCPAERVSAAVGDRHVRVVEGCFDESDRTGDVATHFSPLVVRVFVYLLLCHN